jgi:hypothetical protein
MRRNKKVRKSPENADLFLAAKIFVCRSVYQKITFKNPATLGMKSETGIRKSRALYIYSDIKFMGASASSAFVICDLMI